MKFTIIFFLILCILVLIFEGEPAEHLTSLASYLDLVRVSLPQWILEQDLHHQNHHFNHHKKKVGGHNSMAKQFGSLGKKFRKNLAKMTSNSKTSSNSRDHLDHSRTKVVSANQSFILGLYSIMHTVAKIHI